jgi:uncharacterized iron-regulated membrane protein
MSGGVAIALLTIAGFAGFILWGKTGAGKQVLRETLGDPAALPPRKPASRRRASNATTKRKPSGTKTTAKKKPANQSRSRR